MFARHYFLGERLRKLVRLAASPVIKIGGWIVINVLSGGRHLRSPIGILLTGIHPFVFIAAVTAVLFYLYIFLRVSSGPPLKETAPTLPLHRSALTFGTLGLLLICGINE